MRFIGLLFFLHVKTKQKSPDKVLPSLGQDMGWTNLIQKSKTWKYAFEHWCSVDKMCKNVSKSPPKSVKRETQWTQSIWLRDTQLILSRLDHACQTGAKIRSLLVKQSKESLRCVLKEGKGRRRQSPGSWPAGWEVEAQITSLSLPHRNKASLAVTEPIQIWEWMDQVLQLN